MRDIIFTAKRQKCEFWCLLGAFVVANAFNIGAIITYESPVTELYTSIDYVLCLTAVLYALSIVVRLLCAGARYLIKKIKTNN